MTTHSEKRSSDTVHKHRQEANEELSLSGLVQLLHGCDVLQWLII